MCLSSEAFLPQLDLSDYQSDCPNPGTKNVSAIGSVISSLSEPNRPSNLIHQNRLPNNTPKPHISVVRSLNNTIHNPIPMTRANMVLRRGMGAVIPTLLVVWFRFAGVAVPDVTLRVGKPGVVYLT